MKTAGRPKYSTKDINRKRVLNPKGRKIDHGGPQYKRLIRSGYKLNSDNQLELDKNYVAPVKVRNPFTQRLIFKSGVTFKELKRNIFTMKI